MGGPKVNGKTEHCHLCDEKFRLENEESVAMHNLQHKEELEGIKFSNNMKDAVKTICKLCNVQQAMSRMREHTKKAHNVHVSEYKARYNIISDRGYEMVERIFHRCGICSHPFPLDSDLVAGHIRKHGITHANYNAKYMVIKSNDPERKNKQSSKKLKPQVPKENEISKTETVELSRISDANIKGTPSGDVEKMEAKLNKVSIGDSAEKLFSQKNVVAPSEGKIVTNDNSEPKLSYAEQISLFLRGKQMGGIVTAPAKETPKPECNMSKPTENKLEPSIQENQKIDQNKTPLLSNSIMSETPAVTPALLQASPAKTPPLQSCQKVMDTNTSEDVSMPLSLPNTDNDDNVAKNTFASSSDEGKKAGSSTIRILTPQAINERHEKKNNCGPFKTSLPSNMRGQNAIKKVKLKNGKVLHLFINRNSKISQVPVSHVGKPKTVSSSSQAKPGCIQEESNTKATEEIPEDPLLIDTDTPAFQVPEKMDVDPVQSRIKDNEETNKETGDFEKDSSGHITGTPNLVVNKDDDACLVSEPMDMDGIDATNRETQDNDMKDTNESGNGQEQTEGRGNDTEKKESQEKESTIDDIEIEIGYQDKSAINPDNISDGIETMRGFQEKEDIIGTMADSIEKDDKGEEEKEDLNQLEVGDGIEAEGDNQDTEGERRGNLEMKDNKEMETHDSEEVGLETGGGNIETENDNLELFSADIAEGARKTELGSDDADTSSDRAYVLKSGGSNAIDEKIMECETRSDSIEKEELRIKTTPIILEELDVKSGSIEDDDVNSRSKDSQSLPVPDSDLDDSGFSDVFSASSDLSSPEPEQTEFDKSTEELINRLALKTKQMLESQIQNSPCKDKVTLDPVEKIERSKEFSEMMKRIADNLAVFNGNKPALLTNSNTSLEGEKNSLESNEDQMENDVNEDELDFAVEDIWSENSLE